MEPSEEDIAWFKSTFHPIPKPALPDDCIEYSLQVINPTIDRKNDSELRLRLREVQKASNQLQKEWLKDYIWQRQGFALELVKEDGVSFLRGRTEYGDSIEDEWVIVWLLRELTKRFEDAWVKVTDSDGEFLLIEASGTLPAWLEPEVAENRVWINQGQLKIIKPANSARSAKRTEEKLSIGDAHQIILAEPKRLMNSTSIEEEAFYRLRNYPDQIKDNIHHALIKIPRKLAYLLLQKPTYISPAIEAFYLRDPVALKPLQSKGTDASLIFPPNDLVTVSVAFPKVAYAQVKSQDFPAPPSWKTVKPDPEDASAVAPIETGIKTACGFEMLLTDSQYQDRPSVREMKLLLEDVVSGDALLPDDEALSKLEQRADNEKWLDIDFDDLQNELNTKEKDTTSGKKREFGDKAAQENLQRIVKQFETFLNEDADSSDDEDSDELEEVGTDDDDDEDKDASFGEDEFSKLMQEMMGMPPEVMKELMTGKINAMSNGAKPAAPLVQDASLEAGVQEADGSGDDTDEERLETIMKQMEQELRATGALDLNPQSGSGSNPKSQQAIKASKNTQQAEDPSDDDEAPNDIDADLARNLLQSLSSQGGQPGPTGTLMDLVNRQRKSGSKPGPRKP